jgi:hypothetical protein
MLAASYPSPPGRQAQPKLDRGRVSGLSRVLCLLLARGGAREVFDHSGLEKKRRAIPNAGKSAARGVPRHGGSIRRFDHPLRLACSTVNDPAPSRIEQGPIPESKPHGEGSGRGEQTSQEHNARPMSCQPHGLSSASCRTRTPAPALAHAAEAGPPPSRSLTSNDACQPSPTRGPKQ